MIKKEQKTRNVGMGGGNERLRGQGTFIMRWARWKRIKASVPDRWRIGEKPVNGGRAGE